MIKRVVFSLSIIMRSAKRYAFLKIFIMLVTALVTPVSILVLQKIINSIEDMRFSARSMEKVLFYIGIFALLKMWELAQAYWNSLLELQILKKLKENLLPAMAQKAGSLDYSNFEKTESQDVFFRLGKSPHETIWNIFDVAVRMSQDMISLLGIAYIFAGISGYFLLIFGAVLIPVTWCDYHSTMVVRRMHQDQTYAERELKYYDGLLYNKYTLYELKILNTVSYIQDVWKKKAEKVLKEQVRSTAKSQLLLLSSTLCLFLFTLASMILILFRLHRGFVSIGVFVTLVNAVQSVYSITYSFSDSITLLNRRLGEIEYFESFFSMPDRKDGEAELKNEEYVIDFEHVSFTYPGAEKPVLSDLSFHIASHEKICIVGQNGAGKSTVIKLLCGLYVPDSGCIKVNGVNISQYSREELKKVRSVVFQDYFKFYSTIRENVAYSDLKKLNDDEAVYEALKCAGASEIVGTNREKMDVSLGNLEAGGIDLSGGQWQKLAIARACLCKSKFMIMDEPTASMDPVSESRMYHDFSQVLKDYGYIFISHRLASTKMADRILVIENGELAEDGSHVELMALQGLYYRMYMEQSSWYQEKGGAE